MPPGWKRHINNRGRVVYVSPPPTTQIRTKSELLRYQSKGRYKELDANNVNFLVKKKKTEKNHEVILPETGSIPQAQAVQDNQTKTIVDISEDIQSVELFANVDEPSALSSPNPFLSSTAATSSFFSDTPSSTVADKSSLKRLKTVEHEIEKINSAVKLLTLDTSENLDHRNELKEAVKLLNDARSPVSHESNLEHLKETLADSSDLESLVHQLWKHPGARSIFQQLETSSSLEDFLEMGRDESKGPLKTFPPSVNENIYNNIVKYSLDKSKNTVMFLVDLLVKKDKPVTANDAIHIAFIFSYLAHKVSRENNALVKLKTLLVDKEGTTLEGVDALAALGVTETSRSLRNLKNFLSGISPELIKSSAQNFPHQSTIDNLDLKINDVLHQMTLEYIELEQHCTSDLDTTEKSVEEALEFFDKDTILLSSDKNKHLKDQLEKVVATSVGREIVSRVPGAQFLNKLLKNHHDHPTSKLDRKPAVLFVKKPQYLSEMKNTDMIKICQKLQLDFLELTAENVVDKGAFLDDLKLANTVDCDIPEREAAEKRIHDSVKEAGVYIGHGDQLTFQRFYEAKRLCRTSVTAIERLEYLAHFRLALFHTKMSKTFMDYKACMVNDNNVVDILSVSWLKAYLGLDCISNQESKIKKTGAYEIHDQFVTEVGMQFLTNAFENYLDKNADKLSVESELDA